LYRIIPVEAVGRSAVVPAGIINAPVAAVPTTPLAVTVVATIVLGVVAPKEPFSAPVAAPARPVVPSKTIDISYPFKLLMYL
jgi:hypothetical protein